MSLVKPRNSSVTSIDGPLANVAENCDCIIIIIIIKRGWQCKAGRQRLTPYQSKDPNPTTPTHRKKEEKGKTVGDKK